MNKTLYTLLAATSLMLQACHDEADPLMAEASGPEVREIQATIGQLDTRATTIDYVGRKVFAENDVLVLTSMKRTPNPLDNYTYTNVRWKSNKDLAWKRELLGGYATQERVYWSDGNSPHTFIGYSTPQSWIDGASFKLGKWNSDLIGSYSGQFTPSADNANIIDFTTDEKLKDEDILLTYSTAMYADLGGLTTTIHFKHALASLRVVVDIQGFSPNDEAEDAKTKISDMILLNQPWKYTWWQEPKTSVHDIDIPGWGVGNVTTEQDGSKNIQMWQPHPEGEGTGQNREFSFYSLIVPGKQTDMSLKYTVKYPKAVKPSETITKTFEATISEIIFKPGYRTTLRVSLNHQGEPLYIGAEYIDWENVEIPDRSELQKVSTNLDVIERIKDDKTLVSIASDVVATKDDATWLYFDGENLKDIYGNDGTSGKPFLIKSARKP